MPKARGLAGTLTREKYKRDEATRLHLAEKRGIEQGIDKDRQRFPCFFCRACIFFILVAGYVLNNTTIRTFSQILRIFIPVTIYIDADAFPNALKQIVYRAVKRCRIPLVLVACQRVRVPESSLITSLEIETGPDAADDWIAEHVQPGDLVITQDIPLADRVVSAQAFALDPRGDFYSASNIKDRLATRNLLEQLRTEGIVKGGPSPFGQKEKQAFANSLDRFLTKMI